MKADYKNWVPKGMIYGLGAATAGLTGAAAGVGLLDKSTVGTVASAVLGAGALGCGAFTAWCVYANGQFSYDGKRKLSKQIVEGTAEYITLPEGGVGLDIGCGSGALTIACAKRNPQGTMVGIDRWGAEYASFNKELCEENAVLNPFTGIHLQVISAVSASGTQLTVCFPSRIKVLERLLLRWDMTMPVSFLRHSEWSWARGQGSTGGGTSRGLVEKME